jgi:hypothetical protein
MDRIEIFYRQYLQQVSFEKLSFPPDNVLLDPIVQSQMCHFLFTTHFMYPSEGGSGAFLPLVPYQKRVLKELIRRIEAAIRNPDEDVGHILPFACLFSLPYSTWLW